MSREAMEAVQDHSTVKEPTGRNIFMAIARFVPADASPGWSTLRVLADVSGHDKDTVSRWLNHLSEIGEIETWHTGAGRGTRTWFRIKLPFNQPRYPICDNHNPQTTTNDTQNSGDNNQLMSLSGGDITRGDIIELLSPLAELLSPLMELLSPSDELLSPSEAVIVPTKMGTDHHRSPIDHHLDHQGDHQSARTRKDSPPPLTPLSQTKADQRVKVILDACELDGDVPKHRDQAEFAAVQLFRYEPEYIRQRFTRPDQLNGSFNQQVWNWYLDDFRGQKGEAPTPNQLVMSIGKSRPVPAGSRASPTQSKEDAFAQSLAELEQLLAQDEEERKRNELD